MFENCIKLTHCGTIPESVQETNYMFKNCESLSGHITFDCQPTEFKDMFVGTKNEITISGKVEQNIIANCKNIIILEDIV